MSWFLAPFYLISLLWFLSLGFNWFPSWRPSPDSQELALFQQYEKLHEEVQQVSLAVQEERIRFEEEYLKLSQERERLREERKTLDAERVSFEKQRQRLYEQYENLGREFESAEFFRAPEPDSGDSTGTAENGESGKPP